MNLSQLQAEYAQEVIGPLILSEIERSARGVAMSYPPRVYARAERWNKDTISELVQDVVIDRLLKEHQLNYLFDVSRTIADWRSLLARQVRITLAHRRVTTVVDNLLSRSKRILARDPYSSTAVGRTRIYYLGEERPEYAPMSQRRLRHLAESVRSLPRDAVSSGTRAAAVYSTRVLTALLLRVAEQSPTGLAVRDIAQVLEILLTDWVPAILDQEDSDARGSRDLGPAELNEVSTLARQAVVGMDDTERELFCARLAGLPDTETAPRLGISRPTLIKKRNSLFNTLSQQFGQLDETIQTALIDEIAILLLEEHERNRSDGQVP